MNLIEYPPKSMHKLQKLVENAFNGLKVFSILKTSIEIGIFDSLNVKTSCGHLSEKLGMDPVLTYHILEILVKLELVEKIGEFYKNTPLSKLYLDSKSDYKRTNCILSMEEPANQWNNLKETLKGKIGKKDENFFPFIIKVLAEECLSGELQDTVKFLSRYDELHKSSTLLDLGGGHGLYSIAFNQLNPKLQCYVFDLPDVLNVTRYYIEKYNSNVETIPGNFHTDDFRGEYDIVYSSYNPGGKNPKIAKKVYRSLNPNGLFINKQHFPEDRHNSLADLLDDMEWNFTNFEKSNKGSKRFTFNEDLSFDKYLEFLEGQGFSIIDIHPITHVNTSFGTLSEDKIIVAKKVI